MKKTTLTYKQIARRISAMALCCLSLAAASCSDDDNNDGNGDKKMTEEEAQAIDYTSEYADAWGNYTYNVALLIAKDSKNLYDEWNNGFAADFKNHTSASGYSSAIACVQQILEGCNDIANEVGTAKIGEPVDYWTKDDHNKALYAVESWYSWHSRDDYKNNILSIANSLLGERLTTSPDKFQYDPATVNQASIIAKCMMNNDMRPQSIKVWQAVCAAWTAIDDIPQPFRNNIGSEEAAAAMEACANLSQSIEALNSIVNSKMSEEDAQEIVERFVDNVALPTYKDLAEKNEALLAAVRSFKSSPSNATFENACNAWLAAREPWETSEAFLFGPVSSLGLDPNMDSWPLDAIGIANLLKSQNWSEMEWNGSYDEDNEAIEAAQSLRGYHTLEFLLFKNGVPRTVK